MAAPGEGSGSSSFAAIFARLLRGGDEDSGGGDGGSSGGGGGASGADGRPLQRQFSVEPPTKVCVVGCGAYGTAMATVCARNKHAVCMLSRDEAQVRCINDNHVNPKYLSEYTLPELITATTELPEALDGASLIILTLPAQATPAWLAQHRDELPPDVLLCSTAKGLHLETKHLLSRAMLDALGRPEQPLALLSGPSFAAEIMQDFPTAVVVASRFLPYAVRVQRIMSSLSFRVYTSQDTVGVELGGALKNPLAIGAGMIEGMGMGTNTMAAFVTRSCKELRQLCVAMGGDANTIAGLAGVGDLMLTAFGSLSRNRSLGMRLVKGERLEDITATMTVEGVPTAEVAVYYADICGLELPLFRGVAAILKGDLDVSDAQGHIMGRPLTQEMRDL